MHGWLVVMYSCLKSISMQGWTETRRPEDEGRRTTEKLRGEGKEGRMEGWRDGSSKLIVKGESTVAGRRVRSGRTLMVEPSCVWWVELYADRGRKQQRQFGCMRPFWTETNETKFCSRKRVAHDEVTARFTVRLGKWDFCGFCLEL